MIALLLLGPLGTSEAIAISHEGGFVGVSFTGVNFRDFLDVFRGNGATVGLTAGYEFDENAGRIDATLGLNNAFNLIEDQTFTVTGDVVLQMAITQDVVTSIVATGNLYGGEGLHFNNVSLAITASGTASGQPIQGNFVTTYDIQSQNLTADVSGLITLDSNARFGFGLEDFLSSTSTLTYNLDTIYQNGDVAISGSETYSAGKTQIDYTGQITGLSINDLFEGFGVDIPPLVIEKLGEQDIDLRDIGLQIRVRGEHVPENILDGSYRFGFGLTSIPEPSTFLLVGSGFVVILVGFKRQLIRRHSGRVSLPPDNKWHETAAPH